MEASNEKVAPRTVCIEWDIKSIGYIITDEKRVIPADEAKRLEKDLNLQGKGVHIFNMPEDLWSELSTEDWRRCQAIFDAELYAQQCADHHDNK